MGETAAERIVWSADVPDIHAVMNFLDLVPSLKRVKIDRLFVDRNDEFVFGVLKDRGVDVFYDAKFIEIPSKLEELAKTAIEFEPWMLNCMAGSISNNDMTVHEKRDLMDGLRRFADICLSAGVRPCGVTVLTSKTEEVVGHEFKSSAADQVLWYVDRLVAAQFTDVVCSPLEAEAIKQRFGNAIEPDTPGVRFGDSQAGDQARVATPRNAIEWGSARIIMGRDLTKGDPAENFARAIAEVDAALAA